MVISPSFVCHPLTIGLHALSHHIAIQRVFGDKFAMMDTVYNCFELTIFQMKNAYRESYLGSRESLVVKI